LKSKDEKDCLLLLQKNLLKIKKYILENVQTFLKKYLRSSFFLPQILEIFQGEHKARNVIEKLEDLIHIPSMRSGVQD
jgi:hypothetical protein